MNKKVLIKKYGGLFAYLYRTFHHNKIRIKAQNVVNYRGVFMNHCHININGANNILEIESGLTRLYGCKITINASHCTIKIGADCNLHNASLYIEDDGGSIIIGRHVTISGRTNIDVIEGASVDIGADCLFSANIQIRVGDSHSIVDALTGKRINPSKDVVIGNHVWVCNTVDILKGAFVSENSVVASRAVVVGKYFPANCVIGGIPAKVLKEGVSWDAHRLPIE